MPTLKRCKLVEQKCIYLTLPSEKCILRLQKCMFLTVASEKCTLEGKQVVAVG